MGLLISGLEAGRDWAVWLLQEQGNESFPLEVGPVPGLVLEAWGSGRAKPSFIRRSCEKLLPTKKVLDQGRVRHSGATRSLIKPPVD